MNEMAKIDGCIAQALRVNARAQAVITNAQSKNWPYSSVSHSTKIFCAILAAQARDLAERATKQVGLELKEAQADDRAATIETFLGESAALTGTDFSSMATARLAAQDALTKLACDLVARAERVLEGDETLSGQEIVHGALYDK